jgi:hypothetical protein
MTFTLSGFTEGNGHRRFAFQCVGGDGGRKTVIVRADVSLARKHEIRLQELPLICLRLLQNSGDDVIEELITLTEDQMIAVQTIARSAAEKKFRKPPRRPSAATGQAWRNAHL